MQNKRSRSRSNKKNPQGARDVRVLDAAGILFVCNSVRIDSMILFMSVAARGYVLQCPYVPGHLR